MTNIIEQKKRIFSGIQPTGTFTLGNYLGAVRGWGALQEQYNCIYCVVDMHALTIRQDPERLRAQTRQAAALLLASGIDPAKSLMFVQSHVPAHAQLAWILSCNTQFGELSRMTQFKDKSAKHADNVNSGLFSYPTLMAADILVYNADAVPVGEDQRQHIELTRNIALRFNGIYGDTFVVPEGLYPKTGARIMSLQDPTKKMSKSDSNENGYILMLDEPDKILKKFKRAVTDNEGVVRADFENKPGITSLMSIYSSITGKSFSEIETEFSGKGYGDFKAVVGETVADELTPIRIKYNRILADTAYVDAILKQGAQNAAEIANITVQTVYNKVGFMQI